MFKFFLFLLFVGLCRARTSSDLQVRIDDGRMVGRYLTSQSGRTIRAFMGIPYAEPPIGELRFRAPLKIKKWPGILLAQNEPPMCTQRDPFTRSTVVQGQEDCLYLNVYTPEVQQHFMNILIANIYETFNLLEEKHDRETDSSRLHSWRRMDVRSWGNFTLRT